MKEINLERVIGKSEEQQILDDVAKIGKTNPGMEETLSRLLAMAKGKKSMEGVIITPAMRAGAAANEKFHKPRLQGEE